MEGKTNQFGIRFYEDLFTPGEWWRFLPEKSAFDADIESQLDAITAFALWVDEPPKAELQRRCNAMVAEDGLRLTLVQRLDRHMLLLRQLGTRDFARLDSDKRAEWERSGL